ncbi:MAG TPA: TIM barrel protein [Atribacteraceae bacterium]|nr:TIM barrel protein [Atribacteraceae bacterium]
MPYWCLGNPIGDPFGPGVLDRIGSLGVTDILCAAKKEALIDYTAAHDCDLVSWNPHEPDDDLDPSSETSHTIKTIRDKLDSAGIRFKMISSNLHADPVFRNGGLANPDPRIRLLAARKVMRALRIGHTLGAEYFTYWVARDGFESQFAVPWDRTYQYIREGLNFARRYAVEKNLGYRGGTIEYKPNEPRGEMFLPTAGHALALISTLEEPDFWGCNPEVLQHDQMAGLSAVAATAFVASLGKLFFIHVGNQKPNQFDNDNPPLTGMDGVKEFISILYVLYKLDWPGYIEYDNHLLRTDAAPGTENAISLRRYYVELAVEAYRLAERKALDLFYDRELSGKQNALWNQSPEIADLLTGGNTENIASVTLDYQQLVQDRIRIGEMDLAANRRLLGY